jgi:hypothetical protein
MLSTLYLGTLQLDPENKLGMRALPTDNYRATSPDGGVV